MRSGSMPENAQSRFVARHFMPRPMRACPPSDVMVLSVVFGVLLKSTEMGEMGADYVSNAVNRWEAVGFKLYPGNIEPSVTT